MRITMPELLIAASAIGALCLLLLSLWWSEQNRQRDQRRRETELVERQTAIARHCAAQRGRA